jgi:hypothetical protein
MVTGKVVRHDKGDPHGTPFYVVDHGDVVSAKVPAHKAVRLHEETAEKFQRATKTDLHYTGMINGKTYVVPHAFQGDGKTIAMRHAIVVNPTHTQHNNPTLKPEEVARVNQHIKDIHGGQESAKLGEELTYPDRMTDPKRKEKLTKGSPEYKAEREKYRYDALYAGRRAATLAFAKKHHIINEGPMKKPNYNDPFAHHQTVIAKKTLRSPDAMLAILGGGATKEEARKHLKKIGWTDEQIHKHEHYMEERTLTPAEDNKKEELVHKMKKNIQGFKERYGKDAKSVMYATATKNAKRLAEEKEETHKYYWHHTGSGHSGSFGFKGPRRAMQHMIQKHNDPNHPSHMPQWKYSEKKIAGKWQGHIGESTQIITELKVPKIPFLQKHVLGVKLRDVVGRVHDMTHHELSTLHRSYEKPGREPKSVVQAQQHRSIKKALKRYGDPQGTHNPVDKSKFVKRDLEEGMSTKKVVKQVLAEMMTRKHFQQVADLIRANPDAKKRQELATHHAAIFAKDNPRFDHERFHKAAGTSYKEY